MLYAARQRLIQFLPCWMLVFGVSQAGSFIKQHQTDVPHRVPAALTGDLLCQTLVRGHGNSFRMGGILLTEPLKTAMDLFKEISIPVLIVKTLKALVVMELPRTIPGKGSEFLNCRKGEEILWISSARHGMNSYWQYHLSDGVHSAPRQCRTQSNVLV